MDPIRLYSRRNYRGDYAVADYDPQTRQLTFVEVHGDYGTALAYGQTTAQPGETRPWLGDGNPWEGTGPVHAVDRSTGESLGSAGPFPALWERAIDGQPPSPGYGPTPTVQESVLNGVIGLFGGLAAALGEE